MDVFRRSLPESAKMIFACTVFMSQAAKESGRKEFDMKILVLGGTGAMGVELVKILVGGGYKPGCCHQPRRKKIQ